MELPVSVGRLGILLQPDSEEFLRGYRFSVYYELAAGQMHSRGDSNGHLSGKANVASMELCSVRGDVFQPTSNLAGGERPI